MAEGGRNETSWLKGERVRSHDNEDENGDRGEGQMSQSCKTSVNTNENDL